MSTMNNAGALPYPRFALGSFPEGPDDDDDPGKDRIPKDDHSELSSFHQTPLERETARAADLTGTGLHVLADSEIELTVERLDRQFAEKATAAAQQAADRKERHGRIKDVLYPALAIATVGTVAVLYFDHLLPGTSATPPPAPHQSSTTIVSGQ